MSVNNTKTVLLKMDPNNAWGLNIVNSQYAKEAANINKSLQVLMDQYSKSVSWSAKAIYSVGGAILLGGICEAAANIGGAGSALNAGRESGVIEKECTPQIEELETKIKEKSKEMATANPQEKRSLEIDQESLRARRDSLIQRMNAGYTKANAKMAALQGMSQGLGAVPKSFADSIQQKGQADSSAFNAVQQQTGAAYDNSNKTLTGFINVDYFAGLSYLSGIQLR